MDIWQPPPATLSVPNDEVHVWNIALEQPPLPVESLFQTLDADEQRRAERFVFERDRQRFTVARGMLRTILGRYLECDPATLTFCYGPHGKPALSPTHCTADDTTHPLQFNLSHSHTRALYAITYHRAVGIDLEYIHSMPDMLAIAQRYFCPSEHGILQTLSAHDQRVAFFQAWTRKEAYLKAQGDGLACALDQVEVSLIPGEPAVLVCIAGDTQAAAHWSMQALIPAEGYAAALVVEGHTWTIKRWQW